MPDYVGPNSQFPGFYSVDRERVGPNAFNFSSGLVLTDSSAKQLNRDCLYSGTPGTLLSTRTGITVRRFRGYDSGRAFMSLVVGKDILVEDYIAEKVARSHLNCEPYNTAETSGKNLSPCENIVMRRGQVGNVNFFLQASKGAPNEKVSVLFEDIASLPGTAIGQLLWAHASPAPTPFKSFTMRRVAVNIRGTAQFPNDNAGTSYSTYPLSDVARFWDEAGVQPINSTDPAVKAKVTGDPAKAVQAWNCKITLEDVWINGRPITLNDCQWQWIDSKGVLRGIQPVIIHTPGWSPSMIARPSIAGPGPSGPSGSSGPSSTGSTGPVVDPCAALKVQVTDLTAQVAAFKTQVSALSVEKSNLATQVATLTTEKNSLVSQVANLTAERDLLLNKIAKAKADLA